MIVRVVFASILATLAIGNALAAATATVATPASTTPATAKPTPANAGWLGFSIHVRSLGKYEKRVVTSIRIDAVAPGSPAAAQGIAAGDAIVAIGTRKVSGVRANDLGALISRAVGEPLNLTIRRDNGDPREVRLIAVPKPDKPE